MEANPIPSEIKDAAAARAKTRDELKVSSKAIGVAVESRRWHHLATTVD
jgi:hypothetical protein